MRVEPLEQRGDAHAARLLLRPRGGLRATPRPAAARAATRLRPRVEARPELGQVRVHNLRGDQAGEPQRRALALGARLGE